MRADFAQWVDNRSEGLIVPLDPGQYSVDKLGTLGAEDALEVSVEHSPDNGGMFRGVYVLQKASGQRWQTVVRSWTDGNDGWCWVDNSVVGDDIQHLNELDIVAPGITNILLESAVNPRVGDTRISHKPFVYDDIEQADELDDLITSFDRTLPVVVFARNDRRFADYGKPTFTFDEIVERTAARVAGIAAVAVVSEDVANELTERWGREWGVYNGAFRVYVGDVDPAVTDTAPRHRYVTADRYMRHLPIAASRVGRIVGPRSTLRRPPESFDIAKKALQEQVGDRDSAELLEMALEELSAARTEVIELRGERAALLESADDAVRLQRHLDHAIQLLVREYIYDEFDDDGRGGFVEIPPQTPREVVDRAGRYLSDHLAIHPDALRGEREIRDPDWCARAWSGFRALHAYGSHLAANPQNSIDFVAWLQKFGSWCGWTLSDVALGETNQVRNSNKLWRTRLFPIDPKVNEKGKEYMVAHLKVERRGGSEIPRIYFLYSPKTKKVHVGFYGPHGLVPNTKS